MKHSENKENGGRKHKRWVLVILFGVLLAVVLGAVWLWMTQGNNIKALYLAIRNDKDTLAQIQQEQDKKQDEILKEYGLTRPDSTQSGGEDDLPVGETTSPNPTEKPEQTSQPGQETGGTSGSSSSGEAGGSGSPSDEQTELQEQLQQKINQLYDVEKQYRDLLDDIVDQTQTEFWSLPKDQQTKDNKMAIVKSKASMLIEQENQCDARVDAILDDIREILQQMGKSSDLADQISSYYEESKANWKAAKMTELYS